jgi:hypothetical protein
VTKRSVSIVLAVAFSILMVLSAISKTNAQSFGTSILISPSIYIAHHKGESFNIAINVNNVQNLASYQLSLTYNKSLLSVTQVSPGLFFPSSPSSHFTFDNKTSSGSIQINCSLSNPSLPKTGSGALAVITFTVIYAPNSTVESPLELGATTLLDQKLNSIVHDSVDGLYFWKAMEPDPPIDGRLLDLYTQRGGVGSGQPGGIFSGGAEVDLTAQVTYNGAPVQSKLVAFQVQDPLNQTEVLRTATTDQNGSATVSFKIPNLPSSYGTWMGIAVVDIAEVATWDTITFLVTSITPVGGFSISLSENARVNALPSYYMAVLTLILAFVAIERKTRRT